MKTLRPDRTGESAAFQLLQEAWTTGRLEHPNVVPVHDVGLDENGAPMVVMRRVEGEPWSRFVGRPRRLRRRHGTRDPLQWHIRVLMQVCGVLEFAHEHGIVHRDLKPENVMIGEFGEVYLLDWGIALSLTGDREGRLPQEAPSRPLAGTPSYMAPEMRDPKLGAITERTDIYLLGATLYEVLCGRPPHAGGPAASQSLTFPDDVPTALSMLCRHALAERPDDRPDSAESFRRALQEYLDLRGSLTLAAEAERGLQELEALVRRPDAERDEAFRAFGACRFGFRHALAGWPENERATAGLQRAVVLMTEMELRLGHPDAAVALLAELSTAPIDLETRVQAALQARAAERSRLDELEQLKEQVDPQLGTQTRAVYAFIFGLLLIPAPIVSYLAGWPVHHWMMCLAMGSYLVFLLIIIYKMRSELLATQFNRRLAGYMVTLVVCLLLLDALAWVTDIPLDHSIRFHTALLASVATMLGIAVDRRVFLGAAAYWIAVVIVAWEPSYFRLAIPAGDLTIASTAAWIWRDRKRSEFDTLAAKV